MSALTISTLFSGGGGVECGAIMAGLKHLWGAEYDNKIARVARDNGFNTITANVLDIDPATMERPDVLHASPVCTNASVANSDGEEAELDKATARKTAEFIKALQPKWFTLENVFPYRNFESFSIITGALSAAGYSWDYWHLNAANYGVPQTRKRLILIARLGLGQTIHKPRPTHHKPSGDDGQMSMFEPTTSPWVGWYEAIEDLIPTLPESEFAPWQLKRLPSEIVGSFCSDMQNAGRELTIRELAEPFPTVTAQLYRRPVGEPRAFLIGDGDNSRPVDNGPQPSPTVSSSNGAREFLVNESSTMEIRHSCEPSPTQLASTRTLGTRAWLIGRENAGQQWGGTKYGDETAMAITKNQKPRAWLSQGRVVKLTPRSLARLQSFPDDYKLPDKNSLAVKIIGNSVPPLLYQHIAAMFE